MKQDITQSTGYIFNHTIEKSINTYLIEWQGLFTKAINSSDSEDSSISIQALNEAMELPCKVPFFKSWDWLVSCLPAMQISNNTLKYIDKVPSHGIDDEYNLFMGHIYLFYQIPNEALGYYNAVSKNYNSPSLSFYKAMAHKLAEEYEEAISHLTKYIKERPTHAYAYYERGLCNYELKYYSQAEYDLSTASMFEPNYFEYQYGIGLILNMQGEYDKALSHINHSINIANSAETQVQKGVALGNLKKYDQAVTAISMALHSDPSVKGAHLERAKQFISLGYYEKALADLDVAINQTKKSRMDLVYFHRGRALEALDRSELGLEAYTKSLELTLNSNLRPTIFQNRGNCWLSLKDNDKAKADYNRSIELNPDNADAYYNRALANTNLNLIEEAIEDFSTSLNMLPDDPLALRLRAELKAKTEDFEGAYNDLETALLYDSNSYLIYETLGDVHALKNNIPAAIEAFNKAVSLKPRIARIYFKRAQQKEKAKNIHGSMMDLTQALQLDSTYEEAKELMRSITSKNQQAASVFTQNTAATNTVEPEPDNDAFYFKRALTHSKANKTLEALEDLNKAIELSPNNSRYYTQRGVEWMKLKDYTRGIQDFNKANELTDRDVLAIYNRAVCYYYLGEYENSIADYTTIIESHTPNAPTYANRGRAYAAIGENDKAVADFEKCIGFNPKSPYGYLERGNYYMRTGQNEEALKDLNMLIKLQPTNATFYNSRGQVNDKLNRTKEAIADFEKTSKLDPQSTYPYINMGNLYRKLNQPTEALAAYNKAISLNPKEPLTFSNMGLIYYDMALYDEAMKCFDKAIANDPEHVNAYYFKSLVYIQNEDTYDEALEELEQTLILAPNHQDALEQVGAIMLHKEEYKKSKEALDHLLNINTQRARAYFLRSKVHSALQLQEASIEDAIKAHSLDPDNFPL
ncbi:tetratricopeptide repeat protein [Fulvivirga maritima]|uniref:tetratricopeptide repeat protein n=1 Tax=Fulvivirga maritima TaxID=2904247 RepID=UPI001F248AF0|nr:tetratricopeptide repeat protein [Fulvivirga maritima]UII27203.1 tetratricopeptide repeat protein [Fulvivirga maritima]